MMSEVQNMKLLGLASLITLLSSAGCAYQNPGQPSTPAAVDLSAPSQVTLGVLPGIGAQAGTATLTARVQNANGAGLANVIVTFTTSNGNIAPARVSTGAQGTAIATLAAADTAEVTAAAGAITTHTLVAAPAPPTSTPSPTPNPAPTPTPTPAPTTPPSFLNVSASATTGVPLTFGVSSSVTGVIWNWSFGDGASAQTTAFNTSHTYATAGIYTASVSSSATSAATARITVVDPTPPTPPTPPPPTPAPTLAASMTCSPVPHPGFTSCNVSATFGGSPIPSASITRVDWDWGDGSTNTTVPPTAPVSSRSYVSAGTYQVFATVTAATTDGPKTTTTSKSVIVP